MTKKIYLKRFFRIIASSLIIILVMSMASMLCNHPYDNAERTVNSFYNLQDNYVDYVFLGSSSVEYNVYPAVIFKQYGLTGCNLCVAGASRGVYLSMLKEIENKYPKALLIVDIEGFIYNKEDVINASYNIWLDTMKKNQNWIDSIELLDPDNKLEHYLPILKYHKNSTRFYAFLSLTKDSILSYINHSVDSMYGANVIDKNILSNNQDTDFKFYLNKLSSKMPDEESMNIFNAFINECRSDSFRNVIFTNFPKIYNLNNYESINEYDNYYSEMLYLKEIIEKNGYSFIDFYNNSTLEKLNLKIDDFADCTHMNISGAKKMSLFFGEYFIENYTFSEKPQDIIDSWNQSISQAYEEYNL